MKKTPYSTWVEYFLKNMSRLETLTPDQLKEFWKARAWHPVVNMLWLAGLQSEGRGTITYPDRTQGYYERVDRSA